MSRDVVFIEDKMSFLLKNSEEKDDAPEAATVHANDGQFEVETDICPS